MSNFKILGAQRVKALTEMLKEQEAATIAEVNKDKLTYEQAEDLVNEQLGVKEYFDEIREMQKRIDALNDLIEVKTGYRYSLNRNSRSYGTNWSRYTKLVDKAQTGDTKERIAKVTAEFKRKEQRLWLCETLEEAKAIVGIE